MSPRSEDRRQSSLGEPILRSAYRVFFVLVTIIAATALYAQFREAIEVRLVEIDVVVTDRDGKRVHNLKPEDFEVFEGRTRQEITNFSEYGEPATPANAAAPGVAATEAAVATTEGRQPQSLLILIDRLPRTALIRSREFENLDKFVSNFMHDGDRTSVVFWSPGYERSTSIVESSDRDAVRRALRNLATVETTPGPGELLRDQAQLQNEFLEKSGDAMKMPGQKETSKLVADDMDLMFFRRKTRALTALVRVFAAGPGKKTFLYVSEDFAMPEGTARPVAVAALEEVARAANAGGVTIYASGHPNPPPMGPPDDPLPLKERKISALQYLTLPTGGLYDFGHVSLATIAPAITEDTGSYYSIAYKSQSDGRDRKRAISVRAKNRDYRVRTRESFVEKSKETVARETILTSAVSGNNAGDLVIDVREGTPRKTGRDRWLLPLLVRIPSNQLQFAPEKQDRVALVKVLVVAVNGVAELTPVNENDLRVVAGKHDLGGMIRYSIEILVDRKGSQLSIGALDVRSGRVGTKTIDLRGRFH